jgi:hypothetical protein
MPISEAPKIKFVHEGQEIYITADGVKIAMREHSDTPKESTWETLTPGWSVLEDSDGVQIRGPRDKVKLH